MKRGRKGMAQLALVGPVGIVPTVHRPRPPAYLSEPEAAEWKAVVNRLPPAWFPRETHALLTAYVRHVVRGHDLAARIAGEGQSSDLREYRLLLLAERQNTAALGKLADTMRISQKSTLDNSVRKAYTPKFDPWTKMDEKEETASAG